ncbi:MAG: cytidine deaminase [Lachnospiraceae bacterium]|nr:cytidine deaminase [Lachnospiraceae bacterium]
MDLFDKINEDSILSENGITVQAGELIDLAFEARERAYTPYSHFQVGAALLAKPQAGKEEGVSVRSVSGKPVFLGFNIENASYGATNCAERTALFKAVSEGYREFSGIAIVGGPEGEEPSDYAYPCGICRQVMAEFCGKDFFIIVAKTRSDYKVYSLKALLPEAFTNENL